MEDVTISAEAAAQAAAEATAAAHLDQFETVTDVIREKIDILLDAAETLLPLVTDAQNAISTADFAIAKLRRTDDVIGEGQFNSVAAVQQIHKGLTKALTDFNQHVLQLFDTRRQMGHLHPSVVAALRPGGTTNQPNPTPKAAPVATGTGATA